LPITVHPPLSAPGTADKIDLEDGADWRIANQNTLQILDDGRAIIAEFSPQAWAWVERST
jgi:hypothetical protein